MARRYTWEKGDRCHLTGEGAAYSWAKEIGCETGVIASDPDAYGKPVVRFDTGDERRVRPELLRRTPRPGINQLRDKAKAAAKPRKRKEAVDPRYGVETTIFDHLGAT